MLINCSFDYITFNKSRLYTCMIYSSNITRREMKILKFKGKHQARKSEENVKAVWFDSCVVNYIPKGLVENFPNLIALGVINCNLKEVKQEDLQELKNLKFIYIHRNITLKSLPDDLFVDMNNLREISIIENVNLKHMSSKLIGNVLKNDLEYVDLISNGCVDAFYCPDYHDGANSVEDLMETMDIKRKRVAKSSDKTEEPQEKRLKTLPSRSQRERQIQAVKEPEPECLFVVYGKEFSFPKSSLTTQSPVFAKLVLKDPEAIELPLQGFKPETVEVFTNFIRTGQMNPEANVFELYILANQFGMSSLLKICEKEIPKITNLATCSTVYKLARLYKSETLKKVVIEMLTSEIDVKLLETDEERLRKVADALENLTKRVKKASENCEKKIEKAELKFQEDLKQLNNN